MVVNCCSLLSRKWPVEFVEVAIDGGFLWFSMVIIVKLCMVIRGHVSLPGANPSESIHLSSTETTISGRFFMLGGCDYIVGDC